jgi:hypothetical protein
MNIAALVSATTGGIDIGFRRLCSSIHSARPLS